MQEQAIAEELPLDTQFKPQSKYGWGSMAIIAGLALFAVITATALLQQLETQPTSGPAPDFTITTFDGEQFSLSEQRGNVVVINFWASWCPPCRDEAPILQDFWERYRDRGVIVVGITYADTENASRAYIEEFDITFPNGPDTGTKISEDYHITGVPETFIVDETGDVQFFLAAPIQPGQLDGIVERLLKPKLEDVGA